MAASDGPFLVVAGGGTGGHLYPALAVADEFISQREDARTLFLATERPIDEKVLSKTSHPFEQLPLPALSRNPRRMFGSLALLNRLVRLLHRRFAEDRPAIVMGTGGMGSAAAVLAARRFRVPVVLMNPDLVPGRANRVLGRRARVAYVQWAESRSHFPRRVVVEALGCPVRGEFRAATKSRGMRRFELDPSKPVLLVTGASQGSRNINEAVVRCAGRIGAAGWQVLHLTGDADESFVREAYATEGVRAVVLPFTHDMANALAAASLVISRAGASFLAELTAVGRPAILFPYPYHRDQHQLENGRVLERGGAARIVRDEKDAARNAEALLPVLDELFANRESLESMASAARSLGRPDAAAEIARDLLRRFVASP